MNRFHPLRQSFPPALVAAMGVVLVLALVAGGVHHHSDFGGSHPCGICSLSHRFP